MGGSGKASRDGMAVRWAAFGLALVLGVWAPRAEAFRNLKEGAPAPDFTLKSTSGADVSLSAAKGSAAALVFVRLGQPKSEKVVEALKSVDAAVAAKTKFLVVVTNPTEGNPAALAGGAVTVLLDPGEEVYGKYGGLVAPSTGVMKPDGTFLGEIAGYSASFKDELEGMLKVALGLATAEEVKAAAEKAMVPDTPEARKAAERELDKALLLVSRKMKDKAVEAARQAVASDETYPAAHAVLGKLLLDNSDANADEAMKHFERALQLAPKEVDAKVGVARVKAIKGDTAGAIAMLQDAVKLNPKPEKVYYQLGLVHEKAGQFDKAAEAYRKALDRLVTE